MKPFSSTYIYSLFEKEYHVSSAIKNLNLESCILPKDKLQLHMIAIDKTINVPIKKTVISDYEAGFLAPIYLQDNVELPTTIPILLLKTKDSSQYRALINITPYTNVDKNTFGDITDIGIDDKKLYILLQTAAIYRRWAIDSTKVTNNAAFLKICANSYANIVYKVLDKKFAIGSVYTEIDRAHIALAYFFATHLVDSKYGKDIACNIASIVDKRDAIEFAYSLPDGPFKDLNDLTNILKSNIKGLGKLDTIHLVSAFSEMWNGTAVPALEYFPYFIHMIGTAYVGAGLMKDVLINGTVRTDAEECMKMLLTVI